MDRRTFLQRVSSVSALAVLPVGARQAVASDSHPGKGFRFAVLNDLHHASADCDAWFARVVEAVKKENLEFCILAGDLADTGLESSLTSVRELFSRLECPVYAVPGNHDCDVTGDTSLYAQVFPGQLNYSFRKEDWQFIGLDSTDGKASQNTRISDSTLDWLQAEVKQLDPGLPTVVFTHFPLAEPIHMAPLNVHEVWNRLQSIKVKASFCGHFHGQHTVIRPPFITTNVCCARDAVRGNFDGDPRKGFWIVHASSKERLDYRLRIVS